MLRIPSRPACAFDAGCNRTSDGRCRTIHLTCRGSRWSSEVWLVLVLGGVLMRYEAGASLKPWPGRSRDQDEAVVCGSIARRKMLLLF